MKHIYLLALLCFAVSLAHAQERTAAGSLNSQMSWTALQNRIEQANGNAKSALTLVNAIKKCGDQKKLYGPGATGADANGCVAAQSSHMHWNAANRVTWSMYQSGDQATINAISKNPLCANVGEAPVQLNFCQTLNKTCYTRTEAKANCTGRGSGTGCNGTPTPGNVTLWKCI